MELTKLLFKITTITNLHVGAGDRNYGIVDKLVQRDPLTNMPEIHSSSLKGALKMYAKDGLGWGDKKTKQLNDVFGEDQNPGKDSFFTAHLLTLPVRSNIHPYFKATCPEILRNFKQQIKTFGIRNQKLISLLDMLLEIKILGEVVFVIFAEQKKEGVIEEFSLKNNIQYQPMGEDKKRTLKNTFGADIDNFILVRDDVFMEFCGSLPVIARNRLDDEPNLWYEEIVPRQTDFFFMYMTPDTLNSCCMKTIQTKSGNGLPVQIGANASMGYGFCTISKI